MKRKDLERHLRKHGCVFLEAGGRHSKWINMPKTPGRNNSEKIIRQVNMDQFSNHEALDRSFLIMEMFNEYVAEHEVIMSDPHLKSEAEKVSALLYDFYNQLGQKFIKQIL